MSINIASLSGIQRYADQHGKGKGKNDGAASKEELTAIYKSADSQPVTKEAAKELIDNFDKINTNHVTGQEAASGTKEGLSLDEVNRYLSDCRRSRLAGIPQQPGTKSGSSASNERLEASHERQQI